MSLTIIVFALLAYTLGLLFAGATEAAESVPGMPAAPEGAESYKFEAEVHKMLDIVVNSLYQNKDVFLRELISNASDALDKFRIMSLTKPDEYKSDTDVPLEVQVEYNSEAKTLTIRDTGIGMTHEDMVKNLGTVARSGTTKFIESLKESGNQDSAMGQIGQFGVGFYSTFLVADRVVVASKNPTETVQNIWESENGSGDFLVYPDPRGNTLERGTEITLHLKEDCVEFSDAKRLMALTKHYSEFVMHPISLRTTTKMQVEIEDEDEEPVEEKKDDDENKEDDLEVKDDEEEIIKPKKTKEVTTFSWEVLNGNQAIWTRDKDEIADEEYQAFYEVLSGETKNATNWVHFNAEGNINFKSILYMPEDIPTTYQFGNLDDVPGAMRLYVRKVLIGNEFGLMPKYLGFIRGVVDSDDLPLNVNRESLQESKILQVIRKKLVRKAIDMIRVFAKESDAEAEGESEIDADGNVVEGEKKDSKYDTWYRKFSSNIKLGVMDDEPNRGKLSKLLRFETSKSNGKLVSLGTYLENMKEWQDEIYVLGGQNSKSLMKSPFLEVFNDKDVEVIFLTDAVDEYLVKQVRDFDGKKFVQISSENVKFKDEDVDMVKRRQKANTKKYEQLTKWLKSLYHDGLTGILRVQVAKRNLGSTPAVVSTSDFGNSANMERILRAQAFQQGVDIDTMIAMKILEINPRHPLIAKLLEACPPEGEEKTFEVPEDIIDSAYTLYDMAMLNGGFPISDPVAHNRRAAKIMQKQFGLESLTLEPEINPPVEEDEPPEPDFSSQFGGMNMEDFNMDDLQDIDIDA
jgi:heat shock protein beta